MTTPSTMLLDAEALNARIRRRGLRGRALVVPGSAGGAWFFYLATRDGAGEYASVAEVARRIDAMPAASGDGQGRAA